MSGSVSKTFVIGNLGADPESRTMQDGKPVVSFSIADTETWKDRQGERKERTTWYSVVIFNEGLCKIAQNHLKKGSKVYVEGKMQSRKYTDNNGVERTVWELVLQRYRGELTMLGGRERGADMGAGESTGFGHEPADLDSHIPF